MTNLSKELCEICGIKPQIVQDYELNEYKIYPDFEQPENYKKLQEIFINNDHSITLSKDWCAISNGDTDFVTDMYNTSFEIHGETFLKAVYNYLTLWIEEQESVRQLDGTFLTRDTSHKLTREECIYPRGYDDLLEDVSQLKQAIRETEWVYE